MPTGLWADFPGVNLCMGHVFIKGTENLRDVNEKKKNSRQATF